MPQEKDSTSQAIDNTNKLVREGEITEKEWEGAQSNHLYNGHRRTVLNHVKTHKKLYSEERREAIEALKKILNREGTFNFIKKRTIEQLGPDPSLKNFSRLGKAFLLDKSPGLLTKEEEKSANEWVECYFKANRTYLDKEGYKLIEENGLVDIVDKHDKSNRLKLNFGDSTILLDPWTKLAEQEADRLGYQPTEPFFTKNEKKRLLKFATGALLGTILTYAAAWTYVSKSWEPVIVKEVITTPERIIKERTIVEKVYDNKNMKKVLAKLEATEKGNENLVALIESYKKQGKEDMAVLLETHRKELEGKNKETKDLAALLKDYKGKEEDIAAKLAELKTLAEREQRPIETIIKKYEINGQVGNLVMKCLYEDPKAEKEFKKLIQGSYNSINEKLQKHHNKSLKDYTPSGWVKTSEGKAVFLTIDDFMEKAEKALKSGSDTAPFEAMKYLKLAEKRLDSIKDNKDKSELDKATGLSYFMYGDENEDIDGYDAAEKIATHMARSIRAKILELFVESYKPVIEYNSFFSLDGVGVKFDHDIYFEKPQKKIDESQFEYGRKIERWKATTKKDKESINDWNSLEREILEQYGVDFFKLYLASNGFKANKGILKAGLGNDDYEQLKDIYTEADHASSIAGLYLSDCYNGEVSGIGRPGDFKPKKVKDWRKTLFKKCMKEMRLK